VNSCDHNVHYSASLRRVPGTRPPSSPWRPRPLARLREARHGAAAHGVVVACVGGRMGRRWGEQGGAGGAEDGCGGEGGVAGGDGGAAAIAAQAVAGSHGVRFLGYSGGDVGCALGRDACGGDGAPSPCASPPGRPPRGHMVYTWGRHGRISRGRGRRRGRGPSGVGDRVYVVWHGRREKERGRVVWRRTRWWQAAQE